eukprot:2420549-Prorocentrum_lima.AAC.1
MTSSLVGSEMCIRDSFNELESRDPHRHQAFLVQEQAPVEVAPDCTIPDKKPVSYTHLTLPTICSV